MRLPWIFQFSTVDDIFLKIIVKNKNLLGFFYVFIIAFKEHLNNQNGFVLLSVD